MRYNDGMQYINIGSKKAFTMQVALIFSCTNFDSNTQDAIFCIVFRKIVWAIVISFVDL